MDDKELHDYLHSMSKKERRELAARLRLVKPETAVKTTNSELQTISDCSSCMS
ncbi:ybl31 [Escherichia coli]|uniref:Ybl31 n=1 Tax=Escherichia coli TaxID=562 RepID=A0A2X1N699_ECOLX|nr:ybl31 [Escherichia coli]